MSEQASERTNERSRARERSEQADERMAQYSTRRFHILSTHWAAAGGAKKLASAKSKSGNEANLDIDKERASEPASKPGDERRGARKRERVI